MTIETVWFFVVITGFWLFDPVPWLVIAVTMLLLRRHDPRKVFLVSVVLGGATGLAVMNCLGGCQFLGFASLGVAILVALIDAAIAAFFVAGLFKLVRQLANRRRGSSK